MRTIFTCITALAATFCAWALEVDGLTYTPNADGTTCTLTYGRYVGGDVVIPETVVDGQATYTVSEIAAQAFAQNSGIESVHIPGTVKVIGRLAFADSSLKSAVLAEGVNELGYSCFDGCSKLEEVQLPSTITVLGGISEKTGATGQAFMGCSKLTNVNIPEGLTVIPEATFRECSSLTNITIPESVKAIKDRAFYQCTSLASVTIPDGVTELGESAFLGCSSLRDVTLSSNLTKISYGTFLWCRALEEIDIPESVTEIETQAFADCSGLTEVVIPNSVERIGRTAFEGCSNVERFEIGTGTKYIGLAALALFDVDESNNYIWKVNEIKVNAVAPPVYFNEEGKTDASDFFFANPDIPAEDMAAFLAGVTLYVPEESLEQYRTADQWSLFKNIRAIGEGSVKNDVSEILGEYVWTYDTEINDATGEPGRRNSIIEISAVEGSDSKVTISGLYPAAGLVIEGTYNSQSKRLSMESQAFTSADNKVLKFYHGVWSLSGDMQSSSEPLIGTFKNGAFTFNQLDLILVTDADDNLLVAADYNKWGDDYNITDSWTNIGKAHFQDGWISPLCGIKQAENIYEVDMEQNDADPYIYRLVNPYSRSYGSAVSAFNNSEDGSGHIVFDVSDPDHVLFIAEPCGFSNDSSSKYYLYNTLAYACYIYGCDAGTIVSLMGDELLYSTYKNGIVTLPEGDAKLGFEGNVWYGGNSGNNATCIWFPGIEVNVGIENVAVEPAGTPEYFNLQGMRILNPEKGQLVIEKVGNKTSKRVF